MFLNVHHKRYADKGKSNIEVPAEWLETLCEPCHEATHFPGDMRLSHLTAAELRDFLRWSIEEELRTDSDNIRRYHGAKQSQAWALLFQLCPPQKMHAAIDMPCVERYGLDVAQS